MTIHMDFHREDTMAEVDSVDMPVVSTVTVTPVKVVTVSAQKVDRDTTVIA